MTNFDKITESPQMLARVFSELIHEIQAGVIKKLDEEGISCSILELSSEAQTRIHLEWLLQPWEEPGDIDLT